MNLDLDVFVPVLGRPANVAPLAASLRASLGETVRYRLLLLATDGDGDEIDAIEAAQRDDPAIEFMLFPPRPLGDYARKINRAHRMSTAQWRFLGADDLEFHRGWFAAALTACLRTGAAVIGTQDLGNRRVIEGSHATHCLVHRDYLGTVDEPDQLLCELYWHEYVDDEFVETAKSRDAFVFAEHSVVEHLHPSWGKAPMDALYARQRDRMRYGARIYRKRRRLWTSW